MDLLTLQESYSMPGMLSFDANEHGLIVAKIATPTCTAELYLQGAHLTLWQPVGEAPVLFMSERSAFAPGKAIRGGVPLVFPWFGPRSATPESERTDGPSHGFARTSEWTLAFAALAGDDLHLTLTLGPNDESRALGYDGFQLALELRLGRSLRMSLTMVNQSAAPMYVEEAMHTYLHVGDVEQTRIFGLAGTEFLDKTDHFVRKRQTEEPLVLTKETDRPYLHTQATVVVEDPVLARRITVAKQGSDTTVVWNPWSTLAAKLADMSEDGWRSMVCVETANAADDRVTLAPGSMHTMTAMLDVERM
jgi:glucose-6-phosphate 1-epimerase